VSSARVAATDSIAREAAENAQLEGGSALTCVLAGYFAVVGASPAVFGAPMSLLLYGFGAARALDGRVRQPGTGAKRPRGFSVGTAIPDSARVAVPTATTAALVALGYDRDRRLGQVVQAGIRTAKAAGAEGRVRLLEAVKNGGAGAFTDPMLHRPWLHVAGQGQGGMLTAADFSLVADVDKAAERQGSRLRVGWDNQAYDTESGVIGAVDRQGAGAILIYAPLRGGLEITGWDVLAPMSAAPIVRGKPRTRPGTFLPAAAPIEIELDPSGKLAAIGTTRPPSAGAPLFRLTP
jgi:gamma-glutamyltranspeptidase/glutathione hydrolase